MKTRTRMTFPILASLTLTILACSLGAPAQAPTGNAPAPDPGTATAAPEVQDPTSTTGVPLDADLSEAEILQIISSSLAAFPWRLNQSILLKDTGGTSTSFMEAQSSTRGYTRSVETADGQPFTVESIILDSTVYVKMTGSGMAESYGLVEGQWAEVPPDSLLMLRATQGASEPGSMADTMITEFAALRGESGTFGELLFEVVGSEPAAGGVATTIYESKGPTFTYRWWIGADQRIYKSTLDVPEATRTILIEYDPGINIEAPIP